jgi:hypothetical protein
MVSIQITFQTREKTVGQDSSSSACVFQYSLCLPSFFQNRFHFLVIIHLLGRCVRAALAFWAHWSRGRRRQGRESTFDLFLSPIDRLPQYVSPSRLAR